MRPMRQRYLEYKNKDTIAYLFLFILWTRNNIAICLCKKFKDSFPCLITLLNSKKKCAILKNIL